MTRIRECGDLRLAVLAGGLAKSKNACILTSCRNKDSAPHVMLQRILPLFLLVGLFLCVGTTAVHAQNASMPSMSDLSVSKIKYLVKPNSDKTWGYDILMGGKKVIDQPNIPGMPGSKGFKTKAAATSVAKLVVSKIKKGQMPPKVTEAEMKALKAI
jgi:hypothetical protein